MTQIDSSPAEKENGAVRASEGPLATREKADAPPLPPLRCSDVPSAPKRAPGDGRVLRGTARTNAKLLQALNLAEEALPVAIQAATAKIEADEASMSDLTGFIGAMSRLTSAGKRVDRHLGLDQRAEPATVNVLAFITPDVMAQLDARQKRELMQAGLDGDQSVVKKILAEVRDAG